MRRSPSPLRNVMTIKPVGESSNRGALTSGEHLKNGLIIEEVYETKMSMEIPESPLRASPLRGNFGIKTPSLVSLSGLSSSVSSSNAETPSQSPIGMEFGRPRRTSSLHSGRPHFRKSSVGSMSSADSLYIGINDASSEDGHGDGIFGGITIKERRYKTDKTFIYSSDDSSSKASFVQPQLQLHNSFSKPKNIGKPKQSIESLRNLRGTYQNISIDSETSDTESDFYDSDCDYQFSSSFLTKYVQENNILQSNSRDFVIYDDVASDDINAFPLDNPFDHYSESPDEAPSEVSILPYLVYGDRLKHSLEDVRTDEEIALLNDNERQSLSFRYKMEGTVLVKQKRYAQAIQKYTNGLRYYPTASLYANRSICYNYLRRYDDALQDTIKSIEIDPAKVKNYIRSFTLYARKNDYRDAFNDISTAYFLDSKNRDIVSRLKSVRVKLVQDYFVKLTEETKQHGIKTKPMPKYQIAFRMDFWPFIRLPRSLVGEELKAGTVGYYLKLGIDLLERCEGKYLQKAIEYFTSAIQLNTKYSYIAYDYRGAANIFNGQQDEGLLDLEKSAVLNYRSEHSRISSIIKNMLTETLESYYKKLGESPFKEWGVLNRKTRKLEKHLFPKELPDPVTMVNEINELDGHQRFLAIQYIKDNKYRESIFKGTLKERWDKRAKRLEAFAQIYDRTEDGIKIEAYLAIFYYENEQYDKACDILERLIRQEPNESLYLTLFVQVSRWRTSNRIEIVVQHVKYKRIRCK